MPVFFAEQEMQVTSCRPKFMAASAEDSEARAVFKTMSDFFCRADDCSYSLYYSGSTYYQQSGGGYVIEYF